MIELPEAITIAKQAGDTLAGKKITDVYGPTHLHKFTFFNCAAEEYADMLTGKSFESSQAKGIFVDLKFDNDVYLSIHDGINMRYGGGSDKVPQKYQMLIAFNDNSFISFTTSMYGGIYVFRRDLDNKYRRLSMESVSPLSESFDEAYFERLISNEKKNISVKALLASEQRIPGVGNGVLQDILFNAGITPKRKILTLSDGEKVSLLMSVKDTLRLMTEGGGRDTETDFLGNRGRYKTVLSKNSYMSPCPCCGGNIIKEAYMGGSVYYCLNCQS